MRLIYILFISVFSLACTSNDEDKNIYDVVINSIVHPMPPPPPPVIVEGNNEISKDIIDSLYKAPLNIAVSSKLLGFKFKNEEASFLDKINKGEIEYYISNKELESDLLFGRNSLSFKIHSEEDLKDSIIYDDYNGVLRISNVISNDNKNEALVTVSYSIGKLSGNTILFYLEKKSESWVVIKSRSLSVS